MGQEVQPFDNKQELYRLAGQDGGFEAMIEFVKANAPMDQAESKRTRIEMQGDRIMSIIKKKFSLKRAVGIGEKGEIYFRPLDDANSIYRVLTPLDKDELIKNAYRYAYKHSPTAANIKAFGETLESDVDDRIDLLDEAVIKVSKELYWDRESSVFLEEYNGDCCHQLFNNRPKNMDRVQKLVVEMLTRV